MAKMTLSEFARRMGGLPPLVEKAILGGMRAGTLLALKSAKNEFILGGNGPVHPTKLTNRTGKLRGSIRHIEPRKTARGHFTGGLKAGGTGVPYARIHELGGRKAGGTGVPYARIHELGGRTRAHTIMPKKARFLSWVDRGGTRKFARKVNHPGSRIPARPFLRPALEKNLPQIEKQIAVALDVAFGKAFR